VAREFLSTYLNDHLAGAQAALEILDLLRRLDGSDVWRQVQDDVTEDRQELQALIQKTGSAAGTLRRAAAWTAEKLVEMKMRIDDPSSDAVLRRLELIEALAIGIDGKQALWTALRKASSSVPGNGSTDYDRLIARAQAQRRLVEGERLDAAARALRP
jgi:hypothetical protein